MSSPAFLASSQQHSLQMKPDTLWASDQLTKSEIDSLRQGKKSIAVFVQKELHERLKARNLEHLLNKR